MGSKKINNENTVYIVDEFAYLCYSRLKFTQYGPKRDVDDWDEYNRCSDWTYKIDKENVISFLIEDCITDDDLSNVYEISLQEIENWVVDNLDALLEKYTKEILEHWEEDAIENAIEKYEP